MRHTSRLGAVGVVVHCDLNGAGTAAEYGWPAAPADWPVCANEVECADLDEVTFSASFTIDGMNDVVAASGNVDDFKSKPQDYSSFR